MRRFLFGIGLCFTGVLCSQSITPFVLGGGGDGITGNMHLSWTFGETFGTTLDNGVNKITQGFHQPLRLNDSLPYGSDTSWVIPNGITPNGDGFNDSWVIDGIDTVSNTVYIFNRWGDQVWKGTDYDNVNVVWRGENTTGALLPSATYFYIIYTPLENKKGWIEITK